MSRSQNTAQDTDLTTVASPAPVNTSAAIQPIIPVYRPDLSGNERRYVLDCVESSWISSIGAYIERFENAVAALTGAAHAIAVCNGTVALHLALHCLGIGPGDEVIVPSFTYIASVNTIAQTGATPVFAECRAADWLIDPDDVARRITPRTRAILPVHLYGAAADMAAIQALAERHGLAIVEDCAEALGTTLDGRHVGRFAGSGAGGIGTFSFFGNKTVTTGEGGMVICDDDALGARLRMVKGQGQSLTRRYWHEELGFNYRMTNICAAIGLAQMERLPAILERKRQIGERYRTMLADLPVSFQARRQTVRGSDWLVSVLLPHGTDRERLMRDMSARGVDTRPVFYCAHEMPVYAAGQSLPVSEDIARRGLSLPSYPTLTETEIEQVTAALRHSLAAQARI
jgi:perosamine synthetase